MGFVSTDLDLQKARKDIGCTKRRKRQAGGGGVKLWVIYCEETMGLAIYAVVTLTKIVQE